MQSHFGSSCLGQWLSERCRSSPLPSSLMPVLHRLQFLQEQLRHGMSVTISCLPNASSGKIKYKFLVKERSCALPLFTQASTCAIIDAIIALSWGCVCVDRGHRHSDGTMEICVWMASVQGVGPSVAAVAPVSSDPSTTDADVSGSWVPDQPPPTHSPPVRKSVVMAGSASPSQAVAVGNRVRVTSGSRSGAMGTAKVVSSSYVALQLDDGVFVPQVSPSVLVRLV